MKISSMLIQTAKMKLFKYYHSASKFSPNCQYNDYGCQRNACLNAHVYEAFFSDTDLDSKDIKGTDFFSI